MSAPAETIAYTTTESRSVAWSRARSWATKGFLAVLDQGLISGSNFAIGVLLARWLTPEDYGGFALAFSIFLLLSQFYISLILEPMSVFGGSVYRANLRGYLGALLWLHLGSALVIFILLAASALASQGITHAGNLANALGAVTLAAPCILLFWLARRAFYLALSPGAAVLGALFYCPVVLMALYLVYLRGLLSSFSAFVLMGIGALLTSVLLLLRLKPILHLRNAAPGVKETLERHWKYGRWSLAGSVVLWIPTNIYFPVLTTFSGMAQAGELKALVNLALPVGQTATALSLLFQTIASRLHQEEGAVPLEGLTRKISSLYAAGAIAYWLLLTIFRHQVVHLLYGGNYGNLAQFVPWLAVASVLQVAMAGPAIGLRAMESPASVFVAYAASSAVATLVGIPLTWALGVRGVMLAMMASSLTGVSVAYALLLRKRTSAIVTA